MSLHCTRRKRTRHETPHVRIVAFVDRHQVMRHPIPGSDLPISAAVEIPAGKSVVYLSRAVAPIADKSAIKGSVGAYGNNETQTVAVLKRVQAQLEDLHLSMGDMVKMMAFSGW